MRAAGVPSRKVIAAGIAGGTLRDADHRHGLAVADALRHLENVQSSESAVGGRADLRSAAAVFEERFPNRVLYISDVVPGAMNHWRNVFIADITPVEEQKKTDHDRGDGPARHRGRPTPSPSRMCRTTTSSFRSQEGATYDVGKDPPDYYIYQANGHADSGCHQAQRSSRQGLYRDRHASALSPGLSQSKTLDRDNVIQARIELHQRLALPPACFLLALIGIPLGFPRARAANPAPLSSPWRWRSSTGWD